MTLHCLGGAGGGRRADAVRLLACLSLVAVIGLATASAQEPPALIEPRATSLRAGTPAVAADLRPGQIVMSSQEIGLRLEYLFEIGGRASARIRLSIDNHQWIAALERIDQDDTGFRSWVGTLEGVARSHVVFTERNGIVSGLVDAVGTTYRIRALSPGNYVIEQIARHLLPSEAEPRVPDAGLAPAAPRAPSTGAPAADQRVAAADDGRTIDVLMLYTPAARDRQGGQSQIEALASQIISDSNTALARSGITPRLRLVTTALVPSSGEDSIHVALDAVTRSPISRGLRDAAGADIVHLLVATSDVALCGQAWLLTALSADFDAYGVSDVICAPSYTATHEIGHNLGSHHAPEDGASNAIFPFSYAYKDPSRQFRTVMANDCLGGGCPRILNFSNPDVLYNGSVTGSAVQNNALSISNTAGVASNWRQGIPEGTTVPTAPVDLRSQVTGPSVTLAWRAAAGATTYMLHVGSAPGLTDIFAGSLGNITAIAGNVPAGSYYWRVLAANIYGASASVEAQFTVGTTCSGPAAPEQFVSSVQGRQVTLQWQPSTTGSAPATYIIEAGSASGAANLYNAEAGLTTRVTVAAPAGTYFVRIRARNVCGVGPPSAERIVSVP